ncbi:MAG: hypothetical protein B7Y83_01285 [Flavobacteriales bacterium 32-34-25]|nr:MAG: hypothetical protein B7Y83_01285 [Flavobacteriales bacterium 32-34-25]
MDDFIWDQFSIRKNMIERVIRDYWISIDDYQINEDGSIDVDGDVKFTETTMRFLTELPMRFNKVTGAFDCSGLSLKTLRGSPNEVGGTFNCSYNQLISLEYLPEKADCLVLDNNISTLFTNGSNCNFNKVVLIDIANISENVLSDKIVRNSKFLNIIFKYQNYYDVWKNNETMDEQAFESLINVEGDDLAGGGGFWLGSVFNQRIYEKQSGADAVAGNEVILGGEYGGQALGWFYPNNYLKSLYDKVNDKRFITYYWPENHTSYVVNNPQHPRFGQPITTPEDNYRRYHWSLKKYADFNTKLPNQDESFKNYIFYRFAETLLLASEAHHNLGNNDIALEYINKVRRRGYGLNPNSAAPAVDFTTWTLNTYLEESARELAFENNRWFLLKRLGLLGERVTLYYRNGDTAAAEANDAVNSQTPWQPHYVNCPIPQSQIDIMGESGSQFNIGY